MKKFFTQVLATMTGCLFSVILLTIVAFALVFLVIALSSGSEGSIDSSSVLHLTLREAIVDRAPDSPMLDPSFGVLGSRSMGLNSIIKAIQSAKTDRNIKGIFIDAGDVRAGFAMLEEIRNELLDFKSSGKFIISYADEYSQAAYFLGSVADSVFVSPAGGVQIRGLAFESMFFKGALDKLGIRSEIFRHGKYKSAVEPFMDAGMSRENREQLDACIQGMWSYYAKECARSRRIDPAVFDSAAEDMILQTSADAKELGLIDRLAYREEVLQLLAGKSGISDIDDMDLVGIQRYVRSSSFHSPWKKGSASNSIAVIYASGDIQPGHARGAAIGSETFAEAIRDARMDRTVKAIVLRVNSPGGGALASDIIWREVTEAKRVKPVIVSMSEYAASGGYYISCGADSIFTDATTLTGSIGVFSLLFNTQELFNSKLGITFDVAKTHSHADYPSGTRPMAPLEARHMQSQVDTIYGLFVSKVAMGRKIDVATLDPICNGRIWSGADAIKVRLADRIGGLSDAIRSAALMAGLQSWSVQELPTPRNFMEDLLSWFGEGEEAKVLDKHLGRARWYFEAMKELETLQGIQMRMPFHARLVW